MNTVPESITYPKGFAASGVHCGIRKNKTKNDLALIYSETECDAAAVYTTNKVKGAPILVTMEHLKNNKAKAVICNSGNANTCNADGVEKANLTCEALAKALDIKAEDVIVASTGVIGLPLDVNAILKGIPSLTSKLSNEGATEAALAIMTTDTITKQVAVSADIDGTEIRIGAIAKGSGMIHPNMATMLCFITSDANIDGALLQEALSETVADTFNMISIDGDTSTNDMVSILASGAAGNKRITEKNEAYNTFKNALYTVAQQISKLIAKDGEGATKLIECTVRNASDKDTARKIAKSVISSSLVKAAMFGADANWGRVLCAIGYSDTNVDVNKVDVWFKSPAGNILLCQNGMGVNFSEEIAKNILSEDNIMIDIDIKVGNESATAYGCDLTYDYVKINGDYRT